jgi:hypothetical protein
MHAAAVVVVSRKTRQKFAVIFVISWRPPQNSTVPGRGILVLFPWYDAYAICESGMRVSGLLPCIR